VSDDDGRSGSFGLPQDIETMRIVVLITSWRPNSYEGLRHKLVSNPIMLLVTPKVGTLI
jgi:hypothetical protein